MSDEKRYSVQEAAEITRLSAHTLRYYERAGLLVAVERTGSGEHRRYTNADLQFLTFLRQMRATGMPIRQLRRYVELVREGDGTALARRDMLLAHREAVCKQIGELQACLEIIAFKVANYDLLGQPGTVPGVPQSKGKEIK